MSTTVALSLMHSDGYRLTPGHLSNVIPKIFGIKSREKWDIHIKHDESCLCSPISGKPTEVGLEAMALCTCLVVNITGTKIPAKDSLN